MIFFSPPEDTEKLLKLGATLVKEGVIEMGKGLVILFVLVKYVEREMIRKYFSSLSHV